LAALRLMPSSNFVGCCADKILRSARPADLPIAGDPLVVANQVQIITLAVAARLPVIYNQKEYLKSGGLISLGPNFQDLFRRAAVSQSPTDRHCA
jgi:ABC-type uncharacterized transport system substrate-binding protein